jgi:hypothetical protein
MDRVQTFAELERELSRLSGIAGRLKLSAESAEVHELSLSRSESSAGVKLLSELREGLARVQNATSTIAGRTDMAAISDRIRAAGGTPATK